MSIKRYIAEKDNMITNAFKGNLVDRGVKANVGSSDVLDMFSIYAQANSSSLEQARILVQFPIDSIVSDRSSGALPESGSVDFFLRMHNAPHGFTTPEKFWVSCYPLLQEWDEGHGLDMESYLDESASNWDSASSGLSWNSGQGGTYASDTLHSPGIPLGFEYKQYFEQGTEDIDINITPIVEQWISTAATSSAGSIKIDFAENTGLPASGSSISLISTDGLFRKYTFNSIYENASVDPSDSTIVYVSTNTSTIEAAMGALIEAVTSSAGHADRFRIMPHASDPQTLAQKKTAIQAGTDVIFVQREGGFMSNTLIVCSDADNRAKSSFTYHADNHNSTNDVTISLTDASGKTVEYKIKNDGSAAAGNQEYNAGANANATATNFKTLLESANGHDGTILASLDNAKVTLIQNTSGSTGETTVTAANLGSIASVNNHNTKFKRLSSVNPSDDSHLSYMTGGVGGNLANYGLLAKMWGPYEDGTSLRSYYTKKFFSRTSQYFFKRPSIDARWDSSIKDDRNNLATSSPHLSDEDNKRSVYYYNYVAGQLADLKHPPFFALTSDKPLQNKVTLEATFAGVEGTNASFTGNSYIDLDVKSLERFQGAQKNQSIKNLDTYIFFERTTALGKEVDFLFGARTEKRQLNNMGGFVGYPARDSSDIASYTIGTEVWWYNDLENIVTPQTGPKPTGHPSIRYLGWNDLITLQELTNLANNTDRNKHSTAFSIARAVNQHPNLNNYFFAEWRGSSIVRIYTKEPGQVGGNYCVYLCNVTYDANSSVYNRDQFLSFTGSWNPRYTYTNSTDLTTVVDGGAPKDASQYQLDFSLTDADADGEKDLIEFIKLLDSYSPLGEDDQGNYIAQLNTIYYNPGATEPVSGKWNRLSVKTGRSNDPILDFHTRMKNESIETPEVDQYFKTGSWSSVRAYKKVFDSPAAGAVSGSNITSVRTSKGVYRADFKMPNNLSLEDQVVYEKWWLTRSFNDGALDEYSGLLKGHDGNSSLEYVRWQDQVQNNLAIENQHFRTNIINLKQSYYSKEKVTFRVYTRDNNWQPNIYTVATNEAPISHVGRMFYRVNRITDNYEVIPYSTGSAPSYSELSYDTAGSYFDFDMSILEPNYSYEICFILKIGNNYIEQKEKFKFRVDP